MNHKGISFRAAVLCFGILIACPLAGQTPMTVKASLSPLPDGYVARAQKMMEDHNWQGAVDCLSELITAGTRLTPDVREKAEFLMAKALYENNRPDAATRLSQFLADYPASVYAGEARLLRADCSFFNGNFLEAAELYEEVPEGGLIPSARNLYTYRKALSLLKCGQYERSARLFRQIGSDKDWREISRYYLSYIDFENRDLDKAYEGFSQISRSVAENEGLAPGWYLAQIDFLRGDYSEAAAKGEELLRQGNFPELQRQMNRIVGMSLFRLGRLPEARPYLEKALSHSIGEEEGAGPDGSQYSEILYTLGVCEYEAGDYASAASRFRELKDEDSAVGQGGLLYLGQCDVRLGDTDGAAMAFRQASTMNYDPDVTQAALFNYIASRTHGGNIPFATGINLYNQFLERFPDSPFAPEVRENLAAAYYNEKNYAAALESINKISRPSASVLAAKQKILYEYGRQLMASGKEAQAAEALKEGVSLADHDKALAAETALWLGDAYYGLKNYSGATESYRKALSLGLKGENATLARYNLAYSYYMQDNYRQAANELKTALGASTALPAALKADARVRLADCRYLTGDYTSAASLYSEALADGAGEPDYAAYRHAVMIGLEGKTEAKIAELSDFAKVYPKSRWNPDVLLELAQTYVNASRPADAVKPLEHLLGSYPDVTQARKGSLMLGTILLKQGQRGKGESTLRRLISEYPRSEEALLADQDLRNLHAADGSLKEYADFLATVPDAPGLAPNEMETLQFNAARSEFADNPEKVSLLTRYLQDYPDGKHLSAALLMLAKNKAWTGSPDEAIAYSDRIIKERPGSSEMIEALMLKAELLEESYPDRRQEALATWRMLEKRGGADMAPEAYAGIMRTTANGKESMEYAGKVLRMGGLSADKLEEATLYQALGMMESTGSAEGVAQLRKLASDPNTVAGARAAVELGAYFLKTGKVEEAMKLLDGFTTSGTPHVDLLARGYLLMSDGYRAQGNDYMAREYLETLRENYPGNDKEVTDGIAARLKDLSSKKKKR